MSIAEFLRTSELDALADSYQSLDPEAAYDPQVREVIEAWDDVQALANLLMYPQAIPDDAQAATLLRGLRDQHSYLRLAAAVGIGQMDPQLLIDEERDVLAPAIIAVIEQDAGVITSRAAASLARVGRPQDVDAVRRLIAETEGTTQHNLQWSLARLIGEEPTMFAALEYIPNLGDWQDHP